MARRHCSKCGCYVREGVQFDAAQNAWLPTWVCVGCDHEEPRQVRFPRASSTYTDPKHGSMPVTAKQLRAIERIKDAALDKHFYPDGGSHNANWEIKQLEIRLINKVLPGQAGTLSVVVQAGADDDEGTMASVFCRRGGHFFVGPRGKVEIAGLKYDSRYKGRRGRARKYPLIYGFSH